MNADAFDGIVANSYPASDRQITQAIEALAEVEREHGPESLHVTIGRRDLAYAYAKAGRYDDAVDLLDGVLAEVEHLLGPDDIRTLSLTVDLASCAMVAGRHDDAIAGAIEAVTRAEQTLGTDDPTTLLYTRVLSNAYRQAGRTDDAIDLCEELLTRHERALGPDHEDTVSARCDLARTYEHAGRYDEALVLSRRVLSEMFHLHGPEGPGLLPARIGLARLEIVCGNAEDAVRELEDLLAARGTAGEDRESADIRANLAYGYLRGGRHAEAVAQFERAVADQVRLIGAEHVDTLRNMNQLGASYLAAGDPARARDTWQRALAICEQVFAEDHDLIARIRANLS